MCKKFFIVAFLTFAIIFVGEQNKVSAADYYVGTYESGLRAYVMTETLHFYGNYRWCTVRVKATDDRQIVYVDYSFDGAAGRRETFKNSQGYSGIVEDGTVEGNIYGYALKVWGDWVLGKGTSGATFD
ncbi:MAG: hypothetical protein IJ563_06695 [Selenomonadaceae bacterium]|nr:hypothetical protein [Selenomonadaceae bacterium]